MFQQSFYKLNEDINDTLKKLVSGEKIISYVKLLSEDLLSESEQLDLIYYIDQLKDNELSTITIINNSDSDSPILKLNRTTESDEIFYQVTNKNNDTILNLVCDTDKTIITDQPYVNLGNLVSLNDQQVNIDSLISNLDLSIESQGFMDKLSEILMNNQYDRSTIVSLLSDYKDSNNIQIRDIITSISYLSDEDVSTPSSWISIFQEIYNSMNSATYNDGEIEFNKTSYEPMFSWRSVISGAISTLATAVSLIGGAIGAVIGVVGHVVGSLLNTVWDASAEMTVNFRSEDVCFAQPLGFAEKNTVSGFAWGTNTVNNLITQVCSPVFKRFLWYQNSKLRGECYARVSYTPKQIRYILSENMWGVLYNDDSIHNYDHSVFDYGDVCDLYNTVDADGYHNAYEYLADQRISNADKDKCVMLNIMLALWCANSLNCLSDHNQSQVYDANYSWTQNFAVNMKYILNNNISWHDFYDNRFFNTFTTGAWNDDEDPVDDIDHNLITVYYGIAPNRNKPFVTPPKLAKEMIIYSLVLASVIVAATITAGALAKRAWRKHCLYQSLKRRAALADSRNSFNQQVLDYNAGLITETQLKGGFNEFYKTTRKYNFWASLHGLARYDMINDFDLSVSGSSMSTLFGSSFGNSDVSSKIIRLIAG